MVIEKRERQRSFLSVNSVFCSVNFRKGFDIDIIRIFVKDIDTSQRDFIQSYRACLACFF